MLTRLSAERAGHMGVRIVPKEFPTGITLDAPAATNGHSKQVQQGRRKSHAVSPIHLDATHWHL